MSRRWRVLYCCLQVSSCTPPPIVVKFQDVASDTFGWRGVRQRAAPAALRWTVNGGYPEKSTRFEQPVHLGMLSRECRVTIGRICNKGDGILGLGSTFSLFVLGQEPKLPDLNSGSKF